MTLANPRPASIPQPAEAGLPEALARAVDWAKERRRRRYVAAVKRRLRRYNPPARG